MITILLIIFDGNESQRCICSNHSGIYVVDPTISGMITVDNETSQILVNVSDPPQRKIFTVAHELGHKVLHLENGGKYVDSQLNMFRGNPNADSEEQRKEVEANQFAAALLMDENLVRELWPRINSVYRMADLFQVSQSAMGYRLDNLGL
jgi:Zn-dependent peptidase ImmA (M78 family)